MTTGRWREYRELALLAVVYVVGLVLYKLPLLQLPYYGDAIGYYIPFAKDMEAHHLYPIAVSDVVDAGHPPLLGLFLVALWATGASGPLITHVFMQLVSGITVLFTYCVGRQLGRDDAVGVAAALLVAVTPLFFFGSSMPQADALASALSMVCIWLALKGRFAHFAVWGSLLVLAKETGVLLMAAVIVWLVLSARVAGTTKRRKPWGQLGLSSVPVVVLVLWFLFHKAQTGFFYSNASQYGGGITQSTLLLEWLRDPVLLVKRFGIRVFQLAVADFRWLGLVVIAAAATSVAVRTRRSLPEMTPSVLQHALLVLVIGAYLLFLTMAGFLNPRYLLPILPAFWLLVMSAAQSLFPSRPRFWGVAAVLIVLSVVAHGDKGSRYGAAEASYEYADVVRVHRQAAVYLAEHHPQATILTNYPGIYILRFPYLGYVPRRISGQDVNTIDTDLVRPGDYDFIWYLPSEGRNTRLEGLIERLRPALIRRFEINGQWTALYDMREPARDSELSSLPSRRRSQS